MNPAADASNQEVSLLRKRHERERRARLEAEAIAERITSEYYEVSKRLEEAQRTAHLGSWEWDMPNDQVSWSEELHRIFGADHDRPLNYDSFFAYVHPDDKARLADAIQRAHAENGTFVVDHRIIRADGSVRYLHSRGEVRLDADRNPVRMIGTAQDVTEQRQAEAARAEAEARRLEVHQLQEVSAFKTRFINAAAHEFFTPLTPVRLSVDLLRRRATTAGDALGLKHIDMIDRNVTRLHRLATSLLDASRLDAASLGLQPKPADLVALITERMPRWKQDADAAGIALTGPEPGTLDIDLDAARISEVLDHLVSNALKFTPRGGQAHIRVASHADRATIEVADNGRGMEPDELKRATLPFNRADARDALTQPGTGLGLYICSGIVALHRGTLSLASDGRDRGTTVTVELPLGKGTQSPVSTG